MKSKGSKGSGRSRAGGRTSATNRSGRVPPTLDDLAARLMLLEASDTPELEALREGLLEIARDDGVHEQVRTSAAEALLKLDEILHGTPTEDGAAVLAEVGAILDRGIRTGEGPPCGNSGETEGVENTPAESAREEAVSADDTPEIIAGANADEAPFSGLPADLDAELIGDFMTESLELIEAAEAALLALEVEPDDMEAVNTVFRAFHTIKGTSGFLGLGSIKELAHRAESVLSRIRDGEIRYADGYADLALRSVDLLKELVACVEEALGGGAPVKPPAYDDLLTQLSDPEAAAASGAAPMEARPRLGDLLVGQGAVAREELERVAEEYRSEPLGVALVRSKKVTATDVAKGLRAQRRIGESAEAVGDSTVRIRTDRLDRLIDMVGELVIAHSMVAQDETVRDGRNQDLARKASQVGKIVRELQDLSMSLRMVPLKPTFQKVNRLVRDLARNAGKSVRLETEGEDTEIDRNMVDIIRDPLVHMVRNAVDHGIESSEGRAASGKPLEGRIALSAYNSGGNVVVELQDDGRGLDRGRILDKAVKQGLVEPGVGLADGEVFNLIFRPGFSTAEKVTDVSGRGVGMDVVRRNIEALRGRVEITSEWTRSTCFKMVLPLTMAITDGMLVQVGVERYIIPTVNIVKSLRPEPGQLSTVAGRGETLLLRGELLPVYRLHRLLGIDGAIEDPLEGLLVIVASGGSRYGLLVDQLLGQQQVVAKPLGKGIGKAKGVSGAAILGDGRVGLILDTGELASLAWRTVRL